MNDADAKLVSDLQAARADAVERRNKLDVVIAGIDTVIAAVGGEPEPAPLRPSSPSPSPSPIRERAKPKATPAPPKPKPTTRSTASKSGASYVDLAVQVLRRHVGPMYYKDIAKEAKIENVNSFLVSLSKAAQNGDRVRRDNGPRAGCFTLLPVKGAPVKRAAPEPKPADPPKREERPTSVKHETVVCGHHVVPDGLDFKCTRCGERKANKDKFAVQSCTGRMTA